MVRVEDITDEFFDLQQYSVGMDGESGPGGYCDVCFPDVTGRAVAKRLCSLKGKPKGIKSRSTTRTRSSPALGHECWPSSHHFVMFQLSAIQVLDYIITHGNRFYRYRTNVSLFSLVDSTAHQVPPSSKSNDTCTR